MEFFTRFKTPPSPGVDFKLPSRTHQECAQECDINYIVSRYVATGTWGPTDGHMPIDGLNAFDGDFQELMDKLVQARELFGELPSSVRDRFANDPSKLIAFLHDESNYDEAVKLGLVRARDPEPQAAPKTAAVAESGTREE